jgi:2-isopropylmalate synthase
MHLVDYRVRILNPDAGTSAVTRVMIDSRDIEGRSWSTVGVSANILDASFIALSDAVTYKLLAGGRRHAA